jgi:hypothetical protein
MFPNRVTGNEQRIQEEANFNTVVTRDETRLSQYYPTPPHPRNKKGHKHQSIQWDTPASSQPKKAGMSNSQIKTILLVVCNVRVEYIPPTFKINHFQAKLQERVQNKRRDS